MEVCGRLQRAGIRVSLFLDPSMMTDAQWLALQRIACNRIELYTESYADSFAQKRPEIAPYQKAAQKAASFGLQVNAGHDLNLENLGFLLRNVPEIQEVSIGHALVCESLYLGFKETLHRYAEILRASYAG